LSGVFFIGSPISEVFPGIIFIGVTGIKREGSQARDREELWTEKK
jgi:hypothetical protein